MKEVIEILREVGPESKVVVILVVLIILLYRIIPALISKKSIPTREIVKMVVFIMLAGSALVLCASFVQVLFVALTVLGMFIVERFLINRHTEPKSL